MWWWQFRRLGVAMHPVAGGSFKLQLPNSIVGALSVLKRAYNYSHSPKVLSSSTLISSLSGEQCKWLKGTA